MINGYSLSKAWFDFARENSSKVKPIHSAVYFWCIQKCNSLKWMKEFQLPTDEACNVLGIAKKDTFLKALNELVDLGVIIILKESKNIYTARYITLYDCPFYHPKKGDGKGVSIGDSTGVAIVTNNKQIKQKTKESEKSNHVFIPPTLEDVLNFFKEKGFTEASARRAFEYYQHGNWNDGKGNQVKNWKQKMFSVWMKAENKIIDQQIPFREITKGERFRMNRKEQGI